MQTPALHIRRHTPVILCALFCLITSCRRASDDVLPSEAEPFFSVRADSAGATCLRLAVTPHDSTTPYLHALLTAEERKRLSDDIDVVMLLLAGRRDAGEALLRGDTALLFRYLQPSSDYTLALLRYDDEKAAETGLPELFTFTTAALPLTGMTIAMRVSDGILHLTPSSEEPYIFFSETLDDWNTYTHNAPVNSTTLVAEINALVSWYRTDGVSLPLLSGPYDTPMPHDGHTWIFFAAPFTEAVNGNPVSLTAATKAE